MIATSLLAYASADIVHHAFGHGGACLMLSGQIISLSSVYLNCSVRGVSPDLGGPFANLVFGSVALGATWLPSFMGGTITRLFWILAAAFNLFWFCLQLAFSAATRTDDWAWAMHQFHAGNLDRFALIAVGAVGYGIAIMAVSARLRDFATPRQRIGSIVRTAWLTAGIFACVTALFDPTPLATILHHAAPQSFGLAIGLLLIPWRTTRLASTEHSEPVIGFSLPWVVAATLVAGLSIVLLGPGMSP